MSVKVLSNSLRGSKIRFKEVFNFTNKQLHVADDIRICLPIKDDSTIYSRYRNNVIKIHYDRGIQVWRGLVFDLYGSLNFNKSNSSTTNLQLGSIILARQYCFDNLLKLSGNVNIWIK